jgi:hypothetical protein
MNVVKRGAGCRMGEHFPMWLHISQQRRMEGETLFEHNAFFKSKDGALKK